MVVHIDPDAKTSLLVSFPRDLIVDIPGQGEAQINAAFNDGPQKVIDTLKENFDIDINHYVEVNFNAFVGIVDAIGEIPVFFPAPARDDVLRAQHHDAGVRRARRQPGARVRAGPAPRELQRADRRVGGREPACRPRPHHPPAELHPPPRRRRRGEGRRPTR